MTYIHKTANVLSSNLAMRCSSFRFHSGYKANIVPLNCSNYMANNRSPAFTIIELIVVLGVIAVMMSFSYPAYVRMSERAKATKDMSNLRQIALATQMYMNDNSGAFPGSASATWMLQLEQKYLSAWRVLESPFDKRSTSESGDGTTAISYGINANILPGNIAISTDKITKPVTFIVFAPAQASTATVTFLGAGNSAAPGVTVLAAASVPGGNAQGGTHNNRAKINALFADWHVETMPWTTFINTTQSATDPDANYRWTP
jgi:prepilin-type processing-associated H-X9-DG protein/prepilin-type N-terminal cleavage/methylation domain-containing protein